MNALSRLLARFTFLRWMALVGLMLGAASSALAAKTYSDNGDGTVTDPTTGLQWMRCSMGQTWDGSTCTGTASTYTFGQANALTGTVTIAGQSDWRMPNIRELQTIYTPNIDTGAFPYTAFPDFWSASTYAPNSNGAWYVFINQNYDFDFASKLTAHGARLVRGGLPFGLLNIARPTTDYVDHGDGTVSHTPTGLMWKQCVEGQNWSGGVCSGLTSAFTWQLASLLSGTSSFAGNSDWRMPTREELLTLVDYTAFSPAINTAVFPNVWGEFWSSSKNTNGGVVNFTDGAAGISNIVNPWPVRLVRAGQVFDTFALTVAKTGAGTVSGSIMTGINCGSACTANYTSGTTVILTAMPSPGSTFTGWSGACTNTTGTCTVSITAAKSVTAAFTANSTGTLITRYRLYSDGTKEHLYTTDTNEYSVLPGRGWLAEGSIYKLFQGVGSLSGVAAVPYYRLYNPLSHQHHWTTDLNEYNVLGTRGWSKEGVDGYILPTAVAGSVPLYRLYLNAFGGLHLWTIDANEKNVLSTSNGWVDEGMAGYVVPLQ